MLVLILPVLFLWLAGLGLLFLNEKNKTHLWYSAFCFTLSLGYFVALFKDFVVPSINGIEPAEAQVLSLLSQFLSALGYRVCPYLLLNIGIRYTSFFDANWKKRLTWISLIPVLFSFGWDLVMPQYGFLTMYITKSPYFWITTSWGVVYGLLGNFFLLQAYWLEQNPQERRNKLLVFLATAPTIPNIFISYLPQLFINIRNMWIFNIWMVLLLATFLLIILIHRGMMGARLTFKRYTTDQTILATSTGTSFLNHAIKNDLQTIMNGLEVLKQKYSQITNDRSTMIIENSIGHMLNLTRKVQQEIQEIEVVLAPCQIQELINQSVENIRLLAGQLNIEILIHIENNPVILGDQEHLAATLKNILMNALEAMPAGGRIEISVTALKKSIRLTISDSGVGIPKPMLSRVLEPFFTTKQFGLNYGLGLTYCHQVMKKHYGTIEIDSEENQGTTVNLNFPNKDNKIIRKLRKYSYTNPA